MKNRLLTRLALITVPVSAIALILYYGKMQAVYISNRDLTLRVEQGIGIPYSGVCLVTYRTELRDTEISRFLNDLDLTVLDQHSVQNEWIPAYESWRIGHGGVGNGNLLYRSLYSADREESLLSQSAQMDPNQARRAWGEILRCIRTGDIDLAVIVLRNDFEDTSLNSAKSH